RHVGLRRLAGARERRVRAARPGLPRRLDGDALLHAHFPGDVADRLLQPELHPARGGSGGRLLAGADGRALVALAQLPSELLLAGGGALSSVAGALALPDLRPDPAPASP